MAFDAKAVLDDMKSKKASDPDQLAIEKTKGTVTGMLIGAAVATYIGWRKDYSLLVSAFVGAMIGGVVSRVFLNKEEKKYK
jgi:Na+/glutamate symporter